MSHKVIINGAAESSATMLRKMLDEMGFSGSEPLYLVKTDAGLLLTPLDPELQESMEAFELVNAKYSSVLRELAK